MKLTAVTFHQPCATLVACGAKRFDPRSYSPGQLGPVAIYAAGRDRSHGEAREARAGVRYTELPSQPGVRQALSDLAGYAGYSSLPFGCVVGIAWIAGCGVSEFIRDALPPLERETGDWSQQNDRAWEFSGAVLLPAPVRSAGVGKRGGTWTWDVPRSFRSVVSKILEQLEREQCRK